MPQTKEALNAELHDIIKQYCSGLLTDVDIVHICIKLKDIYAGLDLSNQLDPNTGLRHPADYKPFN
jgi:hypothetical protein